MRKWAVADRAVAMQPPIKGRDVVVVALEPGSKAIVSLGRGLTYLVSLSALRLPQVEPGPKRGTATATAKRAPCKRCGFAHCQCLELHLMRDLAAHGLREGHEYEREYRFAPERKFAADFRIYRQEFSGSSRDFLVEVEGGAHRSRHRTATGYAGDLEKYNLAAKRGYLVFRYDTGMIKSGQAAREIVALVKGTLTDGW